MRYIIIYVYRFDEGLFALYIISTNIRVKALLLTRYQICIYAEISISTLAEYSQYYICNRDFMKINRCN